MVRKKPLMIYAGGVETLQVQDRLNLGRLNLGPMTQLTVAANAITVTGSIHSIFSAGTTIALRRVITINGGEDGDIILLRQAVGSAGTITLTDNDGNIRLSGDFGLTNPADFAVLYFDGAFWYELATANNG